MRLVKFALPLLFLSALAIFLARAWSESEDAAARALSMERARGQFLARSALVRAAADEPHYQAELRQLLRLWFAEQSDLGNRWPLLRGRPAPFVPPLPAVTAAGAHREFKEFAERVVGGWREGKLDLQQTTAAGGLRIDLLRTAPSEGPQPHLAVDLAVWGAPEELQESRELADGERDGKPRTKATVPLTFRGLSFRYFDGAGRLVAEMPGSGEPSLRVDLPARLVPDAPPGLVLARFEPALFPPQAAEVEWSLRLEVRTAAGEMRPVAATWRSPLDRRWAARDAAAWGGQVR